MRLSIFCVFIFCLTQTIHASIVDTVTINSQYLHRESKCVVIIPGKNKKKIKGHFPVVYLLHGYSGNYRDWVKSVPAIKQYADAMQLMIVCPDGGFSSWYLDSPIDSTMRYESFVTRELIDYIDKHYPTIQSRYARAITGLSMGGHGGLFLGFRHPDLFGACGSMSGGVELIPFSKNWDIAKRIGDTTHYRSNWDDYSVMKTVEVRRTDSLAIMIDCGTEDFFYPVNQQLHNKLLRLKVAHDYIERPGKHDWKYWSNAVEYQLLFFRKRFEKVKG